VRTTRSGSIAVFFLVFLTESLVEARQAPPRDRPPAPTTGTGSIRGHVVDGSSGVPVARARVSLRGPVPRPPVLTDSTGAFEFTKLPEAPYILAAEKSTYLGGLYPDGSRSLRASRQMLTLRDGQIVDNVVVKLFRSGVIAGRVVDSYGDPIESAEVRIMPAGREHGRTSLRGGWLTNDLGEFRVSRLEAGRYLVAVMPPRVFSDNPSLRDAQPPLPEPLPTYYPGALSPDQAQPIVIEKGQTVTGIEIVLAEGTPTLISGTVLRKGGAPVTGNGGVSARSSGSDALPGAPGWGSGIRPDGTFRLRLPPGEYALEARVYQAATGPRQVEQEHFGMTRVSVGTEPVDGITITIGGGASATGRVIFEGTAPLPNNPGEVRLPIYSQDGTTCRTGPAKIAPDWSFHIDGLQGTCGTPLQSGFGRWTLKAVAHKGQDLLERPITFEPGQRLSDVQVTFTDRHTELTMSVAGDDGQPTRDYVAIVFPTDKDRWTQPSRHVRTYVPPTDEQVMLATRRVATSATPRGPSKPPDLSRQAMSGLPPGEYFAVAVDDIDGEACRDPAVLERLASRATRVTVSYDAPTSAMLQRIKLSDVVR
jgi:Carboxypeptidase regulatory-like domain